MTSQLLVGCEEEGGIDEAAAVEQFVETCSPFAKMNGDGLLELKSRISGLDGRRLKVERYIEITQPHEKPVEAPYKVNDTEKTITLTLKSGPVTYHVAELTGSACALLAGEPENADIIESWFGDRDDD
jgi:hypothetical protein